VFPLVPILGTVMCAILLMSLMGDPATRHFFLIYVAIGAVFYFVYGLFHSKLARGQRVRGHEAAPMELPQD
jgi:hypothetical protein